MCVGSGSAPPMCLRHAAAQTCRNPLPSWSLPSSLHTWHTRGTSHGTIGTKIHEALCTSFVPRHFGVDEYWPGHSPLLRSGTLIETSTSNLNSQPKTTINMTQTCKQNTGGASQKPMVQTATLTNTCGLHQPCTNYDPHQGSRCGLGNNQFCPLSSSLLCL